MQVPYITSNLNNSSKTWRWLTFIFCTFRRLQLTLLHITTLYCLFRPTRFLLQIDHASFCQKRNILSRVFEKQSTHPEAPSSLSANDVPVWVKHSLDKYSLQYLACRFPSLHIIWRSEMWFAACISKESHHLVPLRCTRQHTASLDAHISSSDTNIDAGSGIRLFLAVSCTRLKAPGSSCWTLLCTSVPFSWPIIFIFSNLYHTQKHTHVMLLCITVETFTFTSVVVKLS